MGLRSTNIVLVRDVIMFGRHFFFTRVIWWSRCHLSYVPVDVPLLHVVVSPGLHHITHAQVDTDQPVWSYPQYLVLPTPLKSVEQINLIQLLQSDLLWHLSWFFLWMGQQKCNSLLMMKLTVLKFLHGVKQLSWGGKQILKLFENHKFWPYNHVRDSKVR